MELQATPLLVTVHVKDSGPNIPEEDLPRLFELLHADASTTGAGLGLYLASEIARLHGGALSADSRQGKGTTFCLIPPRQ